MNLSPSQELIRIGQQLDPSSPLYNQLMWWRIGGAIDPDKFANALHTVTHHYDAFRLRFSNLNGQAKQGLSDHLCGEHIFTDLSETSLRDAEEALHALLKREARHTFDLSQRLWRSQLIKLGAEDYVWALNQHHLITDVSACQQFYEEVERAYRGHALVQAPGFVEALSLLEQESERRQQKLAAAQTFWNTNVSSCGPMAIYGRQPIKRDDHALRATPNISQDSREALKNPDGPFSRLSLSQDITNTAIYACALMSFLARISGQPQQSLGLLLRGRSNPRTKHVVGMFIETIVLNLNARGEASFLDLVREVVADIQQKLRHAPHGVSQFVKRDAFEVMLNMQLASFGSFAGMDVDTHLEPTGRNDASQLLRMNVMDYEGDGDVRITMDLNETVFDADSRSRTESQFARFFDNAVRTPDRSIESIALDSSETLEALYDKGTPTSHAAAPKVALVESTQPTPTVTHRGSRSALQKLLHTISTRNGPAIVDHTRSSPKEVSYAALDHEAARLAQALSERSVTKGSLVAIYGQPSRYSLSAIIAILRCGAAFVPLNPDSPDTHIANILGELSTQNTEDPVVICTEDAHSRFAECGIALQPLDPSTIPANHATAPVEANRAPDTLCYVLYTSGSSGTPKGVRINDANLAHYIQWASQYYVAEHAANMPFFTALAFDLTLTSIFLPLATGGCVHVHHRTNQPLDTLIEVVQNKALNVIKLTPSHLRLIPAQVEVNPSLKAIILGGESLNTSLAQHAATRWPAKIYNEYGPTETTIGCMIHRFDVATDHDESVPIGRPIDDTRILLLDAHGLPTPLGVLGEICVSGPGVGGGYTDTGLNRNKFETLALSDWLTTNQLTVPALSDISSYYRTGDLGRYRSDGVLEYHGRIDRQVKLNGNRVELDEISARLSQHPKIGMAVAKLVSINTESNTASAHECQTEAGKQYIVGYYERREAHANEASIASVDLRSHMTRYLPRPSIPVHFIEVDHFALTTNGKIDLDALPNTFTPTARPTNAAQHNPPSTEVEHLLHSAWCEVFGVTEIDVNEDYFDLGGDSLGLIQIAAHLADHGWQLSPNDMFDYATISSAAPQAVAIQTNTRPSAEFHISSADQNQLERLFADE